MTSDMTAIKGSWDQRHEYVRHTMGAVVSWFTIFCGLNFATMGWLASSKTLPSTSLVIATALLFISQNVLAVLTCLETGRFVRGLGDAQRDSVDDTEQREVIPVRLYKRSIYQMIAAIVLIALSWIAFAIIVGRTPSSAQ